MGDPVDCLFYRGIEKYDSISVVGPVATTATEVLLCTMINNMEYATPSSGAQEYGG
jgi:hypothetical protein